MNTVHLCFWADWAVRAVLKISAALIKYPTFGGGFHEKNKYKIRVSVHCTEVRFSTLLFGGFTIMAVINPPERKLAKRTSVHCSVPI